MPIRSLSSNAGIISHKVIGRRSSTISAAGRRSRIESPKSPAATLPI
jgi:hypothetical protein